MRRVSTFQVDIITSFQADITSSIGNQTIFVITSNDLCAVTIDIARFRIDGNTVTTSNICDDWNRTLRIFLCL